MSATWHFPRHKLGQPVVNPLGSEHFAEADDDWRPGEVLVRECIQNSLDARNDDDVVEVRFQVREAGSMSAECARYWFATLWQHLRSSDCKLANVPEGPTDGGFVVVEDFGTRGLEGDVNQGGLGDSDNRFFNFFRAEGLSGNPMSGTSGGSWGVGKSVFNRCSSIHTFLALTHRRHDGDVALIGKSLLWHHRCPLGEFQGLGQFGLVRPDNEYMVCPSTDAEVVRRLHVDFGLTRSVHSVKLEPGLSVVIPYAEPDITAAGIIAIVIREYFHPILAGRLRVRVSGNIDGSPAIFELHKDNLLAIAHETGNSEVLPVLQLSSWSLGEGASDAYELPELKADRAPQLDDSLVPDDDERFQALCARFNSGSQVSLRFRLYVRQRGQASVPAGLVVYLKRDLVGSGYRPIFVRGCIVVPNARRRAIRNQSVFALITIDEGPLAVMLRAAEPPAHTYWSSDTANFRGRYDFGKQTIDFVVGAVKFVIDALSGARMGRDYSVWSELFPIPAPDVQQREGGTSSKGVGRKPEINVQPTTRAKPFEITEISGGFKVSRANAGETPLPRVMRLDVAYDTTHGSPFSKYHPADFDLADMKRLVVGAEEKVCQQNQMVLALNQDAFEIQVAGFDPHRDLVVKVYTRGQEIQGDIG